MTTSDSQLLRLNTMLELVGSQNPFQRARLGTTHLSDLSELEALPLTSKQDLLDDQAAQRTGRGGDAPWAESSAQPG
jgi:hypothetical protein